MAWNPSPEVAAVRAAAKQLENAMGVNVDRAVIVFTTTSGSYGYASYGDSKVNCSKAKRLGDVLFDEASRYLSNQ